MTVHIVNGPNLNLLGKREPHIYGIESFDSIFAQLKEDNPDITLQYFQSNIEGELIDYLQSNAMQQQHYFVCNWGAYSHTSIAIYDCIKATNAEVVEVHISNIYAREDFRHTCITAAASKGMIGGLGMHGYAIAISFLKKTFLK